MCSRRLCSTPFHRRPCTSLVELAIQCDLFPRLQVHPDYYKSPLRCLRLTLSSEGPRGLLRGLPATLAREVPGNAIFFTTYEVTSLPVECPVMLL